MCSFCCPVCSLPLTESECTYACANAHSFDKAKNGYVNLLTHASRPAGNHGDNRDMVRARRDFLDKGFYAPLQQKIAALVQKYLLPGGVLLDSGCGEGYYTAAAAKAAPQATILGIDISKEAAKLAAKRCKSAKIAVASAFHLPIADNSIDMLLEVFSPYCATEFDRVLKPGGIFLEVIPGENHLFALKSAVYDKPYKNQVDKFERPGFTLLEVQSVSGEIRLTSQTDIQNLFLMTPYYYKTGKKEQARLAALKTLVTEIEFFLPVYRKDA